MVTARVIIEKIERHPLSRTLQGQPITDYVFRVRAQTIDDIGMALCLEVESFGTFYLINADYVSKETAEALLVANRLARGKE